MNKVIIKTEDNYRNLNGTIQNVYERVGTRVTCLILVEKFQKSVKVDFLINEVTFIHAPISLNKVIIQTKSNYRNLNGTTQDVYEVVGTRVTCLIFVDEFQKSIQVDFNINEVTFI